MRRRRVFSHVGYGRPHGAQGQFELSGSRSREELANGKAMTSGGQGEHRQSNESGRSAIGASERPNVGPGSHEHPAELGPVKGARSGRVSVQGRSAG
jgi:hypothetical protein